MDIMELGAIGELVGGVAVIGSLIYVGLQVRQSNLQTKQRTLIDLNESARACARDNTTLLGALTEESLANLFRLGLGRFGELTKDEQIRFDMWLTSLTANCNLIQLSLVNEDGQRLDSVYAERWFVFLVSILKSPGGLLWWSQTKERFVPEFANQVDRYIEDPNGPPAVSDANTWFSPDVLAPEGA